MDPGDTLGSKTKALATEQDLLERMLHWTPPGSISEFDPECDILIEVSSREPSTVVTPTPSRCYMIVPETKEGRVSPCDSVAYAIPSTSAVEGPSPLAQFQRGTDSLLELSDRPDVLLQKDRLELLGIVWALLQDFRSRGRIEFGQMDLHYLLEMNANLGGNLDVIFVVAATVQALGTTPGIAGEVKRWREELGRTIADTPNFAGRNSTLRPWEDGNLWDFRTWALAMELSQRFIGRPTRDTEATFLTSLTDVLPSADPEWWKLEVATLTLVSIRKASWFWPLLTTVPLAP
jgi:hypothetical protein